MTKINYKGKEYTVKYKHERVVKDGVIQTIGGKTIAYIKINDKKRESAEAICHPKKQAFNKRMGRTVSCGRLTKRLSG